MRWPGSATYRSGMHQIRGRVGRSARRAYAYMTYRQGKVPSSSWLILPWPTATSAPSPSSSLMRAAVRSMVSTRLWR